MAQKVLFGLRHGHSQGRTNLSTMRRPSGGLTDARSEKPRHRDHSGIAAWRSWNPQVLPRTGRLGIFVSYLLLDLHPRDNRVSRGDHLRLFERGGISSEARLTASSSTPGEDMNGEGEMALASCPTRLLTRLAEGGQFVLPTGGLLQH